MMMVGGLRWLVDRSCKLEHCTDRTETLDSLQNLPGDGVLSEEEMAAVITQLGNAKLAKILGFHSF